MITIVYKAGDWRNWHKYHTVMMYFALGNLLYNFLTANYFLWRLEADFIPTHTLTEMLYTFIIFPATSLLFIGNYPENESKWRKIRHTLWYIFWYAAVEFVFMHTGHIKYQYGWSYFWSVGFDCFMFPMLRLFYKRPLIAYLLSIPIAIFFLWFFEVPVQIPVEKR